MTHSTRDDLQGQPVSKEEVLQELGHPRTTVL